jgi:hypothetical protein
MPRAWFAILAVWGGFVVYGMYRRWSLFVDPPWVLRLPLGGFQQTKKRYGENIAVGYFYTIGIGLILFGLTGMFWLHPN